MHCVCVELVSVRPPLALAWALMAAYGWYVVLALVVVMVAWVKLKPYYYAWRKKRERIQEESNFGELYAPTIGWSGDKSLIWCDVFQ